MVELSETPGIHMVGISETFRFSYGWTFVGPPGFPMVGLLETLDFRMVGLLEAPQFPYGWTFDGIPEFV